MEIASIVVAAAAALFAGLTWFDGRRQASAARKAADRSSHEAGRAADAVERVAAAAEQQAAIATSRAERYEVPWRLAPAGGSIWRLTNGNLRETAYYVRLTPVDASHGAVMGADGGHLRERDVGPGEAVDFYGLHAFDEVSDTRVRVQWRRAPDADDEPPWTHPTG